MKTIRIASTIAVAFALLATSGTASASGVAVDATELTPKMRAELSSEIEKARLATPELFKAVYDVASRARELDEAARAPGVPLTRHFKNLGPRAYYPLMELLVLDSHASKDLPASAAGALRVGVIEAVGAIRDARAVPVLTRVLERSRDAATVQAAAGALAKIGTDDAVATLTAAATQARASDSTREGAVLAGMHDCRREAAARFLAARLDAKPDADTARIVIKALGGVGSKWAWTTLPDQGEAAATRAIAAAALVRAYVSYTGEARSSATKALLVVDDASTRALVQRARSGASRDVVEALDLLEKRLASNPVR